MASQRAKTQPEVETQPDRAMVVSPTGHVTEVPIVILDALIASGYTAK